MSAADTAFVGRLGTDALAAVGLGMVSGFVVYAFGSGLLGGVRVRTAHRTGAEDHEGARRVLTQGLWLAVGSGVAALALVPLAWLLPGLLGARGQTAEMATAYLAVMMLGAPLEFLRLAASGWLQGRGDMRTPMIASLMANVLNIVLDPLAIFGWGPVPALGVAGAALTTVLSTAVCGAWLLWRVRRELQLSRPDPVVLREIGAVGVPMGVQFGLEVTGYLLFVSALTRVSEADMAAHVIVIRIVSVSFLPGHALGEAAGVLVGQALGAGDPGRARAAVLHAGWLGVAIMASWALVFWQAPDPLIGVFHPEARVAAIARELMLIAACFQVFDAVAMIGLSGLQGAGDTRFTMVATLGLAWLVKLPLGIALAVIAGMGAVGAWVGLTAEIVMVAVVALWRLRGDRWLAVPALARR